MCREFGPSDLGMVFTKRTRLHLKLRGANAAPDDARFASQRFSRPRSRVDKIVVSDLKDDTFYAVIWVERDGQLIMLDSGKRCAGSRAAQDCPIFVDEQVLKIPKLQTPLRAHQPATISKVSPTKISAGTKCSAV